MPKLPTFENLGEWLNPPDVQDAVIAYMDQLAAPALLRELYRPLGLRRTSVNRVLQRLHNKGIVRRWKIPADTRLPVKHAQGRRLGEGMRKCYLYQLNNQVEL
ncbi:MAG: hypothetical protein KGZ65_09360 [Sphingomonadales bacterium]|nr:hypothetical protein [Sphingomonadaceae bacterium]MBS3931431.1 hypothetical protein [Sphingomonadales bacterium]